MPQPNQRTDYLVGSALNELLLKLPKAEIQQLGRQVEEECAQCGITYVGEDHTPRVIPLMLRPRIINPIQRGYFHYVSLQIIDALKKLCAVFLHDSQVRQLLPIGEAEEQWLVDAGGKSMPRVHTIISRLDANIDLTAADWREHFQFFEANSVGAGGLHYAASAEKIILAAIGTCLQRLDAQLFLEPNDDTRDLLLHELELHARSIGRQRCNIALLDDPRNVSGITEYPHLADYFRSQGHQAVVADPREIDFRNDELYFRDLPLDVLYRDIDVKQCLDIERRDGKELRAVRIAFQRNQVISSLAGEFDHKSCWELFTDDRFAHYFTPAQWRIFKRHILWTRLIRETKTADETGRTIDLVPYTQNQREFLVMKPNRQFGGAGVTLGPEVSQATWESVLQEALSQPYSSVVQRYTPVRSEAFPVVHENGDVTVEDFFVNTGFVATAKEFGIIGRASRKSVVNVARQGALTAVLLIFDLQRF